MASSDEGRLLGSEYQVFLSFRGPDFGARFTNHLYHSLIDAGICVFRDNEELRVGERIDGSLRQAIDNTKIYILILSRNYASSQWCLRELVQIVANTSGSGGNKEILPIFLDVEPNDVKLKTLLYEDAILNLKHEKKLSDEEVNEWRKALMHVDAIKGWEAKKCMGHGELIKLVVEEVVKKLKTKHRLVTEHLVEVKDQVAAVSKLLDIDSSDVREKSSRTNGLVELQKKLLSEIGHRAGIMAIDEIAYGMERPGDILCNKKVLIVLDDVENREQVETLVGERNLYPGSRILITTRNKDINTPKYQILDYEMEVMNIDRALELFSRHAFGSVSSPNDYNDLSREIVLATGRLPLTLEILENNVFWMHDQLRDLGRTIVRKENPLNPRERSRIWTNKEALDAIQTREIKKNVQALYLDIDPRDSPNVIVQSEEIEIQIDGSQVPYLRELHVAQCEALESIRLSSMRKLKDVEVGCCGKLIEIQFSWASESLEHLSIYDCRSFKRLVCMGEAGHDNNETANEMISCEGRLIISTRALNQLRRFKLRDNNEIFEIHVVGSSASWEVFSVFSCPSLRSLRGLPNLKNLRYLSFFECSGLQVVEGLDQLECLKELTVWDCESLERLIDLSTTKLPDDCHLHIDHCKKLCGFEKRFVGPFQSYKRDKVVLVLSNLTSLVQFDLSNGSSWREGSKIRQLVGWTGRLSRLNELSLNLLNVPAPTK
ncbi:disease resistance protein RML1A-like [Eucalyptus grandis]|uniref:disease resistance protein RML1A-like n=1 Tax=Eucalyptus grandis TaxID=71139 RepID=UPI00192EC7EA|nr:disease resistance protein RML1A-like [Eucalyptus grandis]